MRITYYYNTYCTRYSAEFQQTAIAANTLFSISEECCGCAARTRRVKLPGDGIYYKRDPERFSSLTVLRVLLLLYTIKSAALRYATYRLD